MTELTLIELLELAHDFCIDVRTSGEAGSRLRNNATKLGHALKAARDKQLAAQASPPTPTCSMSTTGRHGGRHFCEFCGLDIRMATSPPAPNNRFHEDCEGCGGGIASQPTPDAEERPDFNPNFAQCSECGGTFTHYPPCKYAQSSSFSDTGETK